MKKDSLMLLLYLGSLILFTYSFVEFLSNTYKLIELVSFVPYSLVMLILLSGILGSAIYFYSFWKNDFPIDDED